MSGNSINFDDKKIKKSDFYNKNKKIFNIDDIDVNKILVSKKEQYGKNNSFKYFIGYNDNDIIRPLFVKLPQMSKSVKCLKIINFFLFIVLRLFLSHDKFVDNFFWYAFSLCFFCSDILRYLFFAYSLFLFFSSSVSIFISCLFL